VITSEKEFRPSPRAVPLQTKLLPFIWKQTLPVALQTLPVPFGHDAHVPLPPLPGFACGTTR